MKASARSFRVPALDGIRAYAIAAVVVVHLLGASGVLARADGTGLAVWIWGFLGSTIDIFFIISAFVLFLPAARREGALGSAGWFWIGRAARLLPAFLLTVGLTLVLVAVIPPSSGYVYPSLREIFSHLTLMQMAAPLFDGGIRIGFGINGPLWLISIVVTFYAVLPLIARPFFRHPLAGLAIAAAVTVAWKELVARAPDAIAGVAGGSEEFVRTAGADQFPGWAFSFALGMFGAWAYVRLRADHEPERLARTAVLALPAVVLVYAISSYVRGRHALEIPGNVAQFARGESIPSLLDTAARGALIGAVVIGPAWLSRPFVSRTTARLAELSYGVYLIHYVVIIYAVRLIAPPSEGTFADFAVWTAVVVPPSLLFAWLSRRFIELPVLAWVRSRQPRLMVGARRAEERADEPSAPQVPNADRHIVDGGGRGGAHVRHGAGERGG